MLATFCEANLGSIIFSSTSFEFEFEFELELELEFK